MFLKAKETVHGLREQRAELPAPHLSHEKVVKHWEQGAERQIAQVREREAQELSRLDKLIAAFREGAGGRTGPRVRSRS